MADKAQALYQFWSGFGLPAYDENTVPDDAVMPYITYSTSTDMLGGVLPLHASLWYRSASWKNISQKADTIAYDLEQGTPIPLDGGGYLWIVRGSPFMQRMSDPDDDQVRRIYINVMAEFLTAY